MPLRAADWRPHGRNLASPREDAEGGKVQLWATKHRFRVAALSDEALAIVNRQKPVHGSPCLFTTRNRGRYQRITEMFREVRGRAQKLAQKEGRKIRGLRFHDLRHEYAIRYLENGGKLYLLQRNPGHNTVKQTEDYLAYDCRTGGAGNRLGRHERGQTGSGFHWREEGN